MTVAKMLENTVEAALSGVAFGEWSLSKLPLELLRPVPSDIDIARAQTGKPAALLGEEIGILPSELDL